MKNFSNFAIKYKHSYKNNSKVGGNINHIAS